MAIRIFPNVIAAGVGVVHGVVRRNDVAQQRANPDGSAISGKFPLAMVLEVGALLGGAAADTFRVSPDLSEPLMLGGAALLGSRGGNFLGGQAGFPAVSRPAYTAARPAFVPTEKRPTVLA